MKKILFIVPSLSKGGAERVVANLSRALDEKWEVYIAVFNSNRIDYEYEGELIDLKISEDSNRLIKNYRSLKALKRTKKEIEPDVSISFLPEPNLINVISSRKEEKTIISVRNIFSRIINQFNRSFAFLLKLIFKHFYKKSDKIVSLSKGAKKDLTENFEISPEKIEVIYNPCKVDEIQEKSKEELEPGEREIFENPTIINVGSLTRQKGQWHLIRAFKKIKNAIPDSKLVILGEGELGEKFLELTESMGLEEDVYFLGFKNNPFKYMRKSDVFALSSLYEGLGNVVIESLACGTPVISTDCLTGPREILTPNLGIDKEVDYPYYGEYGILTKPFTDRVLFRDLEEEPLSEEERAFAEIIAGFMKDKELKEKYLNGLERAENFKADKIINQWEKVISSIN